jgi:hypothetical protein
MPLGATALTEDQREGGRHLALILREMAQRQVQTRRPTSPHLYLPRIDPDRANHVVLIDGKRGSGKSTLLLTLLQQYVTAIEERETWKQGPGTWVDPADCVVPVGIMDLEPLSPSTNLLFQLLTHLDRVVVAMEQDGNTQRDSGSETAWRSLKTSELPSRQKWRDLARLAATSWDGNISERKAMLDPKDYALEREDDELRRRNLFQSFTEFMDALAEDYQRWQRQERLPFFLLAVDDADMSPKTFELLEIVRKFWHRRLGYLLTGDNNLFRERIRYALRTSVPKDMRDQLVEEIYNKAIPGAHHCSLRELTPAERLTLVPHFRQLLERLPLAPGGISLAYYFDVNMAAREFLPERPRQLWELTASLDEARNVEVKQTAVGIIEGLWNDALEDIPAPHGDRLRRFLNLNVATGEFRFDAAWTAKPVVFWQEHESRHLPLGLILHVGAPTDFGAKLSFRTNEEASTDLRLMNESPIQRRLMAGLMLSVDATSSSTSTRLPFVPQGFEIPAFAFTEWANRPGMPTRFPWPVPQWGSYVEFISLAKRWKSNLEERAAAEWTAEGLALAFLNVVLSQIMALAPNVRLEISTWEQACKYLAMIAQERRSPDLRQRIHAEWAFARAALLAAPESGLSPETANHFLLAFRAALPEQDWAAAREHLRGTRIKRIEYTAASHLDMPRHAEFLQTIDDEFLGHRFRELVEDSMVRPGAPLEQVDRFISTMTSFDAQFFKHSTGRPQERSHLGQYFWDFRKELLTQVPLKLLKQAVSELDRYRYVRGSAPDALGRIWQLWTEGLRQPELTSMVSVEDGRLHVDVARIMKSRANVNANRVALTRLPAENDLALEVFTTSWITFPLLPDIPRGLDALLRVILDYMGDEGAEGVHTDLGMNVLDWWYGAEIVLSGDQRIRSWPAVSWETLIEFEMLERGWAEVTELAASITRSAGSGARTRYLEALAYWFVQAQVTLMDLRSVPGKQLDIQISPKEWAALVGRCISIADNVIPHGAANSRALAYTRWVDSLPLLATPEAGLSWKTAAAILSVFPDARIDVDGLRSRYREMLQWSNSDGLKSPTAHPWYQWLQKHLDTA